MASNNSEMFDDLESLKARLRERRLSNAPQSFRGQKNNVVNEKSEQLEKDQTEQISQSESVGKKSAQKQQTSSNVVDISSLNKSDTILVAPKKVQKAQKSSLKKLWWLALPVALIILVVAIVVPIVKIKNNAPSSNTTPVLQSTELVTVAQGNYNTYLLNQHLNIYNYELKQTYSNGSVTYIPVSKDNLQLQGLSFINEDLEFTEYVTNGKIPVVYQQKEVGQIDVTVQKATITMVSAKNLETTVYQKGLLKFSTLQVIATDTNGVKYMLAPQDYNVFIRVGDDEHNTTQQLVVQGEDGFIIPIPNVTYGQIEFYVAVNTESGNFTINGTNEFTLPELSVSDPEYVTSQVSLKQTGDNITTLFYSSVYGKENGIVCNALLENIQIFDYYKGGGIFEKQNFEFNKENLSFKSANATYSLQLANEKNYLTFDGEFVENDVIDIIVIVPHPTTDELQEITLQDAITLQSDEVKSIHTEFVGAEKPVIVIGQTDVLTYIRKNYTFTLEMRSGNILTYQPQETSYLADFQISANAITIDTLRSTQIFVEDGKYYATASSILNSQSKLNVYFHIADLSNVQGTDLKVEVTAQKQDFRANLQQANVNVAYTSENFAGLLAVQYADGSLHHFMAKNIFQSVTFKGQEYVSESNNTLNEYLCDIQLIEQYAGSYRFVIAFSYINGKIEMYVYDRVENMIASNIISLQIAEQDWVKKVDGTVFTAALYDANSIRANRNENITLQDFSFYTIEDILEYATNRNGVKLDSSYTVLFKIESLPEGASFQADTLGAFIFNGQRGNVSFAQAGQFDIFGTVCVYQNGVVDINNPTLEISQAPTFSQYYEFDGETVYTQKKVSVYVVVS